MESTPEGSRRRGLCTSRLHSLSACLQFDSDKEISKCYLFGSGMWYTLTTGAYKSSRYLLGRDSGVREEPAATAVHLMMVCTQTLYCTKALQFDPHRTVDERFFPEMEPVRTESGRFYVLCTTPVTDSDGSKLRT